MVKNHIVPYIGHLRISEVNRETFFNLLVKVLPAEEASQVTIRATRKVLSAMCQMAFDEGYRNNNPIRSIRIQQAPAKPMLVASHDQWPRWRTESWPDGQGDEDEEDPGRPGQ